LAHIFEAKQSKIVTKLLTIDGTKTKRSPQVFCLIPFLLDPKL
jgi:hypothetical protein